jgi:hypothetical protein
MQKQTKLNQKEQPENASPRPTVALTIFESNEMHSIVWKRIWSVVVFTIDSETTLHQ